MTHDISKYNRDELTALLSEINKKIKEKEKEEKKAERQLEKQRKAEARRAIEDVAKNFGLKLSDIVGLEPSQAQSEKPKRKYTRKSKKSDTPTPKNSEDNNAVSEIKYRHPQMPDLTWDGKGKQPDWMMEAFTEGFELHELEYHENA